MSSSDGNTLIAACIGNTLAVWDPDYDKPLWTVEHKTKQNCVRWNHTYVVAACAGQDGIVSLYHRDKGTLTSTFPETNVHDSEEELEEISTIAFSKGSRYAATGGSFGDVRVWDLKRRQAVKKLTGHIGRILTVVYSAQDQHIASAGESGSILLHAQLSGTCVGAMTSPNPSPVCCLQYSGHPHTRHLLAAADTTGTVRIWDAGARSQRATFIDSHSGAASSVAFTQSSPMTVLSVGHDKRILWQDVQTEHVIHEIIADSPLTALAIKNDGVTTAAGGANGTISLYDLRRVSQNSSKTPRLAVLTSPGRYQTVTSLHWQPTSLKCEPLPTPTAARQQRELTPPSMIAGVNPTMGAADLGLFSPLLDANSMRSPMTGQSSPTIPGMQLPSVQDIKEDISSSYRRSYGAGPGALRSEAPPSTASVDSNLTTEQLRAQTKDMLEKLPPSSSAQSPLQHYSMGSSPAPGLSSAAHALRNENLNPASTENSHQAPAGLDLYRRADQSGMALAAPASPAAPAPHADPASALASASPIPAPASHLQPPISMAPSPIFSPAAPVLPLPLNTPPFTGANPAAAPRASAGAGSAGLTSYMERERGHPAPRSQALDTGAVSGTTQAEQAPDRAGSIAAAGMDAAASSRGVAPGAEETQVRGREGAGGAGGGSKAPGIELGGPRAQPAGGRPAAGASPALPATPNQPSIQFPMKLMQQTMEDELSSLKNMIQDQVQNLHLELLNQFHQHQQETFRMFDKVLERQDAIMEEMAALRRTYNQQFHRLH